MGDNRNDSYDAKYWDNKIVYGKMRFSVAYLKEYFGFATTNAIYKWLHGESLPSLDNMVAMSVLFGVSMNDIVVYH